MKIFTMNITIKISLASLLLIVQLYLVNSAPNVPAAPIKGPPPPPLPAKAPKKWSSPPPAPKSGKTGFEAVIEELKDRAKAMGLNSDNEEEKQSPVEMPREERQVNRLKKYDGSKSKKEGKTEFVMKNGRRKNKQDSDSDSDYESDDSDDSEESDSDKKSRRKGKKKSSHHLNGLKLGLGGLNTLAGLNQLGSFGASLYPNHIVNPLGYGPGLYPNHLAAGYAPPPIYSPEHMASGLSRASSGKEHTDHEADIRRLKTQLEDEIESNKRLRSLLSESQSEIDVLKKRLAATSDFRHIDHSATEEQLRSLQSRYDSTLLREQDLQRRLDDTLLKVAEQERAIREKPDCDNDRDSKSMKLIKNVDEMAVKLYKRMDINEGINMRCQRYQLLFSFPGKVNENVIKTVAKLKISESENMVTGRTDLLLEVLDKLKHSTKANKVSNDINNCIDHWQHNHSNQHNDYNNYKENIDPRDDNRDFMEHRDHMDHTKHRDYMDHRDYRDHMDNRKHRDHRGLKEQREHHTWSFSSSPPRQNSFSPIPPMPRMPKFPKLPDF